MIVKKIMNTSNMNTLISIVDIYQSLKKNQSINNSNNNLTNISLGRIRLHKFDRNLPNLLRRKFIFKWIQMNMECHRINRWIQDLDQKIKCSSINRKGRFKDNAKEERRRIIANHALSPVWSWIRAIRAKENHQGPEENKYWIFSLIQVNTEY